MSILSFSFIFFWFQMFCLGVWRDKQNERSCRQWQKKKRVQLLLSKIIQRFQFLCYYCIVMGKKKTGMKNCTPHVQKITTMMKYNKVRMMHTQFRFLLTHVKKIYMPLLFENCCYWIASGNLNISEPFFVD